MILEKSLVDLSGFAFMVIETIRLLLFSSIFLFAVWPFHSKLAKVKLNPEKLLMSKWTAVEARDKEKHFLVARVINPEAPKHKIREVEMEAVMSKRRFILGWEELTDPAKWVQGWV